MIISIDPRQDGIVKDKCHYSNRPARGVVTLWDVSMFSNNELYISAKTYTNMNAWLYTKPKGQLF